MLHENENRNGKRHGHGHRQGHGQGSTFKDLMSILDIVKKFNQISDIMSDSST